MDKVAEVAGKVSHSFLEEQLLPEISGGKDPLWSPQPGGDFGAVALDDKRALVAASDPLAISPELGWARSAWLAFHLIAVDVALSGIPPTYLTTSWTLPEQMPDEALKEVLAAFYHEARTYGVQAITGHTGRYHGARYPWVGAATVIGVGAQAALHLPPSARPGDVVLLWGTPGLEAAVVLVLAWPTSTSEELLRWAEQRFSDLSALDIVLATAALPGIRCMHDVTEGGLLGALSELASAMRRGVQLDSDSVVADPRVQEVLQPVGLSPLEVTSCGSVLAVSSAEAASRLVNRGFRPIGVVQEGPDSLVRQGDRETPLQAPARDPFWDVYAGMANRKEEK